VDNSDIVKSFYQNYYSRTFSENGLAGFAYRLTHKAVESQFRKHVKAQASDLIIEIGAGKGEHFKFVNEPFGKYINLDLFPSPENYNGKGDPRVFWLEQDILNLKGDIGTFDRVIVMCVLHHLDNPDIGIANILKLLKPGGTLSLFLSSDPGIMNRINRRILVIPRVKRLGFDYFKLFHAREHQNHAWGLKVELNSKLIGYKKRVKYYPFGIPFADLSLFSVWTVTKPPSST
jgi:SAM-dependent methyltransferase